MKCPKVAVFDLDDTLAYPHVKLGDSIARKLLALHGKTALAVVTAAPFTRIERDFLSVFRPQASANGVYVFSENAAQCRAWKGGAWVVEYEKTISETEREHVRTAVRAAIEETGILEGLPAYGERILDRKAGVTLTTLGVGAPQSERESWDTDGTKRQVLYETISKKLPAWHVYIGGFTSIDISRPDVSKANAIEWLSEKLATPAQEMLYVGDALYDEGNDAVVIPTGIQARQVSDPSETETIIDELISNCTESK